MKKKTKIIASIATVAVIAGAVAGFYPHNVTYLSVNTDGNNVIKTDTVKTNFFESLVKPLTVKANTTNNGGFNKGDYIYTGADKKELRGVYKDETITLDYKLPTYEVNFYDGDVCVGTATLTKGEVVTDDLKKEMATNFNQSHPYEDFKGWNEIKTDEKK